MEEAEAEEETEEAKESGIYTIIVRHFDGTTTMNITVSGSTTVKTLKQEIEWGFAIPMKEQILKSSGGDVLEDADEQTAAFYKIFEGSTVHVSTRGSGGRPRGNDKSSVRSRRSGSRSGS